MLRIFRIVEEIHKCTCKISWLVVVKEGLLEMEVVTQRFEREVGILEKVLKDPCIKDGTYINEERLEELMLDSKTTVVPRKVR